MSRDPSPVAILAARLQRAYPALSPYSAASLAGDLAKIERAQRRHAERCCGGADDGYTRLKTQAELGYVKNAGTDPSFYVVHDPAAEERAGRRIVSALTRWKNKATELSFTPSHVAKNAAAIGAARQRHRPTVELQGDPRGAVLKIRLPGETEATSV